MVDLALIVTLIFWVASVVDAALMVIMLDLINQLAGKMPTVEVISR